MGSVTVYFCVLRSKIRVVHPQVNQSQGHEQGDKSNHDDLLKEIVTGGNGSSILGIAHAGLLGLLGDRCSGLEQCEGRIVPADTPIAGSLAGAGAERRDGVLLTEGGAGFDGELVTGELPGRGFQLERGLVDGAQHGAIGAVRDAGLAQRLTGGLAAEVC